MELVPPATWQWEAYLACTDTSELGQKIEQVAGDDMDDFALRLDPPLDADHASAEDNPTKLFEHLLPDDDVGPGGLVLDGHEHDAFITTRERWCRNSARISAGGLPLASFPRVWATRRDGYYLAENRAIGRNSTALPVNRLGSAI